METPASFAEQQDAKIIRSNLKCDFDKRQVTVGLPWKRDPHVVFPPSNTNRHLVDKMARTLKRGLERDGMIETYTAAFQEAVDRGVYREASPEEIEAWDNSGLPSNYISHHPVLKPGSKTYKCRPVCNSSTPHAGTTLNDELRKGPNSLSNLHHVLLRSTQHPYLLIGDICRAYNSILVPNPVDQHARRLLWLSEEDLHKENPQFRHYLAQTACFGDRPSGYFLEEVKSQLSLWCSQKGPEWAEAQLTLSLYSYVDDLIRSLKDRALALDLMKKIPYVFEQLGFTLKPMILIGPGEEVAEDVPEEASLLGYIYSFRDDTYQINWKVNFSARRRSARVLPDLREDSELDGVIFTPATLLSLLASQ